MEYQQFENLEIIEGCIEEPNQLVCPLSLQLMNNPVLAADGHSYQRSFIEQWLRRSDKSPMTNMKLAHKELTLNHNLKKSVINFKEKLSIYKKLNQIKKEENHCIENHLEDMKLQGQKQQSHVKILEKQILNLLKVNQQQRKTIEKERLYYQKQISNLNKRIQNCKCSFLFAVNSEKIEIQKPFLKDQIFENDMPKFLLQYPQNIKKMLKGAKKIKITPNTKQKQFVQHFQIDLKNPNLCRRKKNSINYGSHLLSNETLPIKEKQSFFYCIKIHSLQHKNSITLGISFPIKIDTDYTYQNSILYCLISPTVYNFGNLIIQDSLIDKQIEHFPSEMIVFVNFENKTLNWIFNKKVQMSIPLQINQIIKDKACFARISSTFNFQIQFL